MLEQSVDRVKSWGESRGSLSGSLLLCSVFQPLLTIIHTSPSKMSGHGKLSRQCTVSTERPSSARPPMVDQCLSVSFCCMASYQPPREALHARSKRTRRLSGAGRQSPHYFFLNLQREMMGFYTNWHAAQQILFFLVLVNHNRKYLLSHLFKTEINKLALSQRSGWIWWDRELKLKIFFHNLPWIAAVFILQSVQYCLCNYSTRVSFLFNVSPACAPSPLLISIPGPFMEAKTNGSVFGVETFEEVPLVSFPGKHRFHNTCMGWCAAGANVCHVGVPGSIPGQCDETQGGSGSGCLELDLELQVSGSSPRTASPSLPARACGLFIRLECVSLSGD